MGTRWSVTLAGEAAPARQLQILQTALAAAVDQVDRQMSPWRPDSDLNRFNRAPLGTWIELPDEMMRVLERSLDIARLSGGAFDPTLGALVDAWGFGPVRETPDPTAIRLAKARPVGVDGHLELDPHSRRARKHAPLQLDLCGIAKGFAVDQMVAVLHAQGVNHALTALDGELRAVGRRHPAGPWPIAVESPQPGRRDIHSVIELQDLAIATSGDYRRFWQIDGGRIAHTMDPKRAAPVHHAVASVSVLATRCMDADAWATALLVAGPDEGPALAQRLGLDALFLLRHPHSDTHWVEWGWGRFSG